MGLEEMALIHDEESGEFALLDLLQDLEEEAFLAAAWYLAQGEDDEFEKTVGADVRQREVDRVEAISGEGVDEEFDEGGLPHAGLTGDEPDAAGLGQVVKAGQALT